MSSIMLGDYLRSQLYHICLKEYFCQSRVFLGVTIVFCPSHPLLVFMRSQRLPWAFQFLWILSIRGEVCLWSPYGSSAFVPNDLRIQPGIQIMCHLTPRYPLKKDLCPYYVFHIEPRAAKSALFRPKVWIIFKQRWIKKENYLARGNLQACIVD